MDPDATPRGKHGEQNLFRPDETGELVSGSAATPVAAVPRAASDEPIISWTASEYITHQKTAGWYALLALTAILIAAVTWLLTRDFFPTTTVVVCLVLLGIYAARKPQEQRYALGDSGFTIGARYHPYAEFRSFAVVPEGAFSSIELTPHKRFAMYTTIYYDPQDEEQIVDLISSHLPLVDPTSNMADNLMRRIHF